MIKEIELIRLVGAIDLVLLGAIIGKYTFPFLCKKDKTHFRSNVNSKLIEGGK